MLTALEAGVKEASGLALMDKVYALTNLRAAFCGSESQRRGGWVDHQTVERFEQHWEENLAKLSESLQDGSYRPQAVRRVWIPKPGSAEKRPLGIPTVRDRVVQAALRHVLEPIWERDFDEQSYGFRPNRGVRMLSDGWINC